MLEVHPANSAKLSKTLLLRENPALGDKDAGRLMSESFQVISALTEMPTMKCLTMPPKA